MDLVIQPVQMMPPIAVEIKSSATFQQEFLKGIQQFRRSIAPDTTVDGIVWYNGLRKTTCEGTAVRNPLIRGFKW